MLLEKVDLLESQTQQYKKLIQNYEYNDSVHSELLETNKKLYLRKIDSLNASLRKETKKRKLSQLGMFGTIGIAVVSVIFIK
jgi:hypothetical protein